MPWQKGQSGNPGGQVKHGRAQLAKLCRECTEEAVETLLDVMRDTHAPAAARVTAATAVLDRGWGKPTQEVKITDDQDVSGLPDDDLDEALHGEIARFAAAFAAREDQTQH